MGIKDTLNRKTSTLLTGGLGRTGKTCGALLGGILALGLKYGRDEMDSGMEGLERGQRATYDLVKWFEYEFGSTDCYGLTGRDFTDSESSSDFLSGGDFDRICVNVCARTSSRVAERMVAHYHS